MFTVFYCTIAVLLRALAHRRVKQGGIDISMKRLLAELDAIKEVIVLYPRKRGAKMAPQHTVLSKTSELQQSLLSILGIEPEVVCPNQRLAVAPFLELKKSKRSFRTREALYFQ